MSKDFNAKMKLLIKSEKALLALEMCKRSRTSSDPFGVKKVIPVITVLADLHNRRKQS